MPSGKKHYEGQLPTPAPRDSPTKTLNIPSPVTPSTSSTEVGASSVNTEEQFQQNRPTTSTPQTTTAVTPTGQHSISPRRLRSGTILNSGVSLEQYLELLCERARETQNFGIPQLDRLDSEVERTREERLAKIKNFKENTLRFKEELLEFQGLSHNLRVENKEDSVRSDKEGEQSDSENETSAGEIVLNWLSVSLAESDSSYSEKTYREIKNLQKIMPDFIKVAKLTSQLIPLFSGGQGENLIIELQTFLGCCKRVIQGLTEEEKPIFIQVFPTRLRGDAYQLIAANQPETFEDAEKLLNQTYLPRETYNELVNKLITTRQYPLEALTAFTSRLKQLLTLCREAADKKYGSAAPAVKKQLEDLAKAAFKSGVYNPYMCQYLLTITDDTIENLTQKALDMERLQQTNPHNLPYAQHTYNANNHQPPASSPGGEINTKNVYNQQYTQPINNSHITDPNYSSHVNYNYTTNTPGNTQLPPQAYSQPENTQQPSGNPQNQGRNRGYQNSQRGRNKITCNFCQKQGHTYSECLKRKNTPFCTNCKMYNHDIKDCRRLTASNNNNERNYSSRRETNTGDRNQSQNGPRVFNVTLKCDFCGRRGHSVDECKQKEKWESRDQGNSFRSN